MQAITSDAMGWKPEDWSSRWRALQWGDATTRAICPARAEQLAARWYDTRDVKWLYSQEEYPIGPLTGAIFGGTASNLRQGCDWLSRQNLPRKPLIADLGAGPGVTTMILASSFPDATIHWVDIGEHARKIAMALCKNAGIADRVIWGGEMREQYDACFAMEMVEHLWTGVPRVGQPFSHPYSTALERTNLMVQATEWTAELSGYATLGHFLEYDIDGEVVPVRRAKKAFTQAMEHRGWVADFTGWNKTPFGWKKA